MTRAGCFAALSFEIAHLRSMGQEVPWEARELLALDVEDAAEAGDSERLETIWRQIPAMIREAIEYQAQGGELLA